MARKTSTTTTTQKGPTATLAKQRLTNPMIKLKDMSASRGEKIAIARAKMTEKFKHMSANIRLSMVRIRHPVNPIHRAAAREAAKLTKSAATERRKQKEAAARNTAANKRALIREKRAHEMNAAM